MLVYPFTHTHLYTCIHDTKLWRDDSMAAEAISLATVRVVAFGGTRHFCNYLGAIIAIQQLSNARDQPCSCALHPLQDIDYGINKHAVYTHPTFGEIYAFVCVCACVFASASVYAFAGSVRVHPFPMQPF